MVMVRGHVVCLLIFAVGVGLCANNAGAATAGASSPRGSLGGGLGGGRTLDEGKLGGVRAPVRLRLPAHALDLAGQGASVVQALHVGALELLELGAQGDRLQCGGRRGRGRRRGRVLKRPGFGLEVAGWASLRRASAGTATVARGSAAPWRPVARRQKAAAGAEAAVRALGGAVAGS